MSVTDCTDWLVLRLDSHMIALPVQSHRCKAAGRHRPGTVLSVRVVMVQVGICHSDYHQVMNEWGNTKFPVVPGCAADMLQSISPRLLAHASGTHVGFRGW